MRQLISQTIFEMLEHVVLIRRVINRPGGLAQLAICAYEVSNAEAAGGHHKSPSVDPGLFVSSPALSVGFELESPGFALMATAPDLGAPTLANLYNGRHACYSSKSVAAIARLRREYLGLGGIGQERNAPIGIDSLPVVQGEPGSVFTGPSGSDCSKRVAS